MKRTLETRVAKLETRAGRGDKALLIWRRPSDDAETVIHAVRHYFDEGDRVMLATFYGDDRRHCRRSCSQPAETAKAITTMLKNERDA